jgi:hypothetical protein
MYRYSYTLSGRGSQVGFFWGERGAIGNRDSRHHSVKRRKKHFYNLFGRGLARSAAGVVRARLKGRLVHRPVVAVPLILGGSLPAPLQRPRKSGGPSPTWAGGLCLLSCGQSQYAKMALRKRLLSGCAHAASKRKEAAVGKSLSLGRPHQYSTVRRSIAAR